MPVPKRRQSKSRRDSRRSQNDKMHVISLSLCPNCGAMRAPHRVCTTCGHYKGRAVIKVAAE